MNRHGGNLTSMAISRETHARIKARAHELGVSMHMLSEHIIRNALSGTISLNTEEFKRLEYERAVADLQSRLGYKP